MNLGLDMVNVVIVDCQQTGISGDKFLASLIDMGKNFDKLAPLISNLLKNHSNCSQLNADAKIERINGLKCTRVVIEIKEEHVHLTLKGTNSLIKSDIENLNLSKRAIEFVNLAFNTIFRAEASVHGIDIDLVHLHEIGSVDTFLDIIGSAILLDDLKLFENTIWKVLPIAVGSGKVKISHGIVSTPAPATLKIMEEHKFLMKGMNIESELSTPTGVAILAALKSESTNGFPPMKIDKVGYGGGSKLFKEHPNMLRLISGVLDEEISQKDMISVLETNVDDVSGEVLGNFITTMTNVEGLKDISIVSTITKKNRPGYLIKILAELREQENIKRKVFEQLGTLGIRHYYCERSTLNREIKKKVVKIGNEEFTIGFKHGYLNDGTVVNIKPEYEDVKVVAEKLKKPFLEVLKLINKEIE